MRRRSPQRGRALVFSSGFENIHYVDALRSGERFTIGTFWTTEPVDDGEGGGGGADAEGTPEPPKLSMRSSASAERHLHESGREGGRERGREGGRGTEASSREGRRSWGCSR